MNEPKININQRFQKHNFRVKPSENFSVDFKNKIVKNVVLCQVGEAKGHGIHVEQRFMDTIVESGSKFETGLKMRFGHPSMCEETFGSFVGNCKNLSSHEGEVRGDIHLSKVAEKSPKFKNDPVSYLLEMANKHPDQIMLSVVTTGGNYYQYDEEGKEYKIKFDDFGYPSNINEDEPVYYEPEHCDAVDFVEAGALTDSLFSKIGLEFNSSFLGPQLTEFLDNNPLFDRVFKNDPDKLVDFIQKRYGSKTLMSKIKELFNNKDSKMATKEFDINGTTTDGTAITIITENSKAGIDDTVTIDETGEPAPDGEHSITDGDMAGQTIQTEGGVIVGVWKTMEEEEEEEQEAEENSNTEEMSAAISSAITEAMSPINEQIDAIKKHMGMPAAVPSTPATSGDTQHSEGSGDEKEKGYFTPAYNRRFEVAKIIAEKNKN